MSSGGDQDDIVMRADPGAIEAMIADLASQETSLRERARLSLVRVGSDAVAGVIHALADPRRQVRWEAAKALGEIADPDAAPALVRALEDSDSSVRWLAAEGLISLESKGLAPLLQALVERSDSFSMRNGAHHVLHELDSQDGSRVGGGLLKPLLAALEDVEPALAVPPAADKILQALAGRIPRSGKP